MIHSREKSIIILKSSEPIKISNFNPEFSQIFYSENSKLENKENLELLLERVVPNIILLRSG